MSKSPPGGKGKSGSATDVLRRARSPLVCGSGMKAFKVLNPMRWSASPGIYNLWPLAPQARTACDRTFVESWIQGDEVRILSASDNVARVD